MTNRIRIAIVLPYFGDGGAEAMVSQLAARIDPDKFLTEVFCVYGEPRNNHLEQAVLNKGIKIHYIGKKKGPSLGAVLRLYRALDVFDPQVVHTHLYACVYAALWPALKKRQILHTVHSLPAVENKRLVRRVLTGFLVRSGRMTPVAISAENQRLIAEYYGIANEKVPVIHNPVDLDRFSAARERANEHFRFVTVGRLAKVKNQQLLLHAFAAFLEKGHCAQLVIVGGGEEEEVLRRCAEELGIAQQVEFTGFVVNVEDYLARADVFLLSSLYEAQPLAVLEAMAAGLPVISTDVGGISDIVTDNGLLVPSEDTDAMSRAMEQLYLDGGLRERMAQSGLHRAAGFDANHTAQRYMELYQLFAKMK